MSIISASTTTTTALQYTADTTGTLVFKTGAAPTTAMTLNADQSVTFAGAVTFATGAFTNLSYTGTLIGGTGVITIGTNQFYKDANGNIGIGTASPTNYGSSYKTLALNSGSGGATFFDMLVNGTRTGTSYASAFEVGYGAVTPSIPLTFRTNDTERMRIDSSGNVMVGVSSINAIYGSAKSLVVGGAVPLVLSNGDNAGTYLRFNTGAANGIIDLQFDARTGSYPAASFTVGGSERMRITSTGAVGIGTSNPSTYNAQLAILNSSSTDIGAISFLNTSSASVSTKTVSAQWWLADTVGTTKRVCSITAFPANANVITGGMTFNVRTSDTDALAEAMRIDSSGNLLIGTTTAGAGIGFGTKLAVSSNGESAVIKTTDGANSFALRVWNSGTTGNNLFIGFGTETSYSQVGSITYNRSLGQTAYNVSSDYRAKTINGNIENAINEISLIKTYKATMNGATISAPMFVAHELAEVAPYCVTGEKDAVDEDGKPIYQQVDSSPLIPLLIKAIQEQQAIITQLQADVAALKGTK
jgi:hypothetical protein